MIARPADFALGIAAVALSVAYLQVAGRIPDSLLSDAVGAAGVPRALGWAAGIIGALLCVRSVRFTSAAATGATEAPGDPEQAATGLRPHLRALGLLAILSGYVLVAPWLGYALTTGLLVAVAAAYAGAPVGRNLLLVAAACALVFWLMFVFAFGIPMPVGTLFERG